MCTQETLKQWLKDFEDGKLDFKDTLALFSYLIRTGEIVNASVEHRSRAVYLITEGIIGQDGLIQVVVTDPETAIKGQG